MNYTKPEIVANGLAIASIQGSTDKSKMLYPDFLSHPPDQPVATTAAYEADE